MSDNSADRHYRVGIVGTGAIARHHGRACDELECVELCAICDISEEALNRYGEQFGVSRRYLKLDEMLLNEELDIAIICTWGAQHAETGIQIAQSQRVKAILCEKPFTSTAAEAEQLVSAAKENDVLIAEAFKFRHHPIHLKAKELVNSGAIGDVVTIRSTFCTGRGERGPEAMRPEQSWIFNKAKGGGSIFNVGCYCIHHARFIFDAEPTQVFAVQQRGFEVDDASAVLLVFPDDRTAQISVGHNIANSHYAEICGTKGMLRLDRVWSRVSPLAIELRTIDGDRTIAFPPVDQFSNQLQHLCDCLTTGQPHRIPPEDSIKQMRVIDACFESIATGKMVVVV